MNRPFLMGIILGVACLGPSGLCLAGERDRFEGPPPGSKLLAGGDVLVTNPANDDAKPSMASSPNGDLFVAVEDLAFNWLRVYRSTDGGASWESLYEFSGAQNFRNPSVAYGESSGEKRVYVAYEVVNLSDDTRSVEVLRLDPDDPTIGVSFEVIDGPFMMSGVDDQVHPQIITDFVDWGGAYIAYVTYSVFALDAYQVFVARTMNQGDAWSTPLDVTGGSSTSSWSTRPQIAFGKSAGLFVTFVKPGWNGVATTKQIWVTRSSNSGASFFSPVQVTGDTRSVFHPSIAVTHGTNRVVVAYTRDLVTDLDVAYGNSTDMGATWLDFGNFPWTVDHESSVDLTVSDSDDSFHAAYKHEGVKGGENQVWYTRTSATTLSSWSAVQVVNDSDTVSGITNHPRPTITLIRPEGEPAIAWTDYRGPNYDVYFNTLEIFSDGFESGNPSAWSSVVP